MIVLDTHVWIWWVDDHPRLKRSVRDQIDREDDVHICAISLLEGRQKGVASYFVVTDDGMGSDPLLTARPPFDRRFHATRPVTVGGALQHFARSP